MIRILIGAENRPDSGFWARRAIGISLYDLDPRSDFVMHRTRNKDGKIVWTCFSNAREEFLTKDGYSLCFSTPKWDGPDPNENLNNPHVFPNKNAVIKAFLLYLQHFPDSELEEALNAKKEK